MVGRHITLVIPRTQNLIEKIFDFFSIRASSAEQSLLKLANGEDHNVLAVSLRTHFVLSEAHPAGVKDIVSLEPSEIERSLIA